MSKREVKRLLGRPHAKITDRGYFRAMRRSGTHVLSMGKSSRNEYWLYNGIPTGHDTQIVFSRGRVTDVSTPPSTR
jgi:hypothetical protein